MKILSCEVRGATPQIIADQLVQIAEKLREGELIGWDITADPPTGYSFSTVPLEDYRQSINQSNRSEVL